MQLYIKFFLFVWSSTCFGWHTAHHQEPKTALAASGFACVEGCWTLQLLDTDSVQQLHVQQPSTHAKPEAASAVLDSWWWAVCRLKHVELHINIKKKLIYCCILLDFLCELYYDAQIHEHPAVSYLSILISLPLKKVNRTTRKCIASNA